MDHYPDTGCDSPQISGTGGSKVELQRAPQENRAPEAQTYISSI
jgi:hypothetical protein